MSNNVVCCVALALGWSSSVAASDPDSPPAIRDVVVDKYLTLAIPVAAKEIPTEGIDSTVKRFEEPDRRIAMDYGANSGHDFGTIDDVDHFSMEYVRLDGPRAKAVHYYDRRKKEFPYISELVVPKVRKESCIKDECRATGEKNLDLWIECRTEACQKQNRRIFEAQKPTPFAVDPEITFLTDTRVASREIRKYGRCRIENLTTAPLHWSAGERLIASDIHRSVDGEKIELFKAETYRMACDFPGNGLRGEQVAYAVSKEFKGTLKVE